MALTGRCGERRFSPTTRGRPGGRKGMAMTLEINQAPERPRAVRDGQIAPVTCAACGCRLEASGTADEAPWFHFGRMGGRDARGDNPVCVEAPHDRSGRPILPA